MLSLIVETNVPAFSCQSLADTKFTYDEEACPEDFFVPYVWALSVSHTRDLQWDPLKINLFPPSDAGLLDDVVPDVDPEAVSSSDAVTPSAASVAEAAEPGASTFKVANAEPDGTNVVAATV